MQERATRKPQPHRCRDCRKDFSIRTGTLIHDSKLGLQAWAVTIHLLTTNLEDVSSTKLHRGLSVTQKIAWHLTHRILTAWKQDGATSGSPFKAHERFEKQDLLLLSNLCCQLAKLIRLPELLAPFVDEGLV